MIAAWGRLGYPRRARWLWEAARRIDAHGWPDDLRELARRRPLHRRRDRRAGRRRRRDRHRGQHPPRVRTRARRDGSPTTRSRSGRGRDRGAAARTRPAARVDGPRRDGVHRAHTGVRPLPDRATCATRGAARRRDPPPPGRVRGIVPAAARHRCSRSCAPARRRAVELDGEALASLLDDGLAEVTRGRAHLPRESQRSRRPRGSCAGGRGRASVRIDSGWNCTPSIGNSRWRRPITKPSSDSAVISSTSGTESRSTTSEW